jgi:hypothetical protein
VLTKEQNKNKTNETQKTLALTCIMLAHGVNYLVSGSTERSYETRIKIQNFETGLLQK